MMTTNFDRQELIGILSSLSDDRLVQALSAAGVTVSPSDLSADLAGHEPVASLTPWNKTEVRVPFTRRPPLVDQSKTWDMPERQPTPALGFLNDPRMDSIAPYAGSIA